MTRARAALACALVLLGCAATREPRQDATTRQVEDTLREQFQEMRARVFEVGYRLRTGGRRLCGELLLPDSGLLLRAPEEGAGIEVSHVASASPLAAQGVRTGDRLVALDGARIADVADFNARILASAGSARLQLQRGSSLLEIDAAIPRVCGMAVNFSEDPGLMTFQHAYAVAVPYGLLATSSEARLAIAISHQMAHVLIEFSAERVDPEPTADRLGLLIAAEAGFAVEEAAAFWEWLGTENPWRIASTGAFRLSRPDPLRPGAQIFYPVRQMHVGIAARLPAIHATLEEIARARVARRERPASDARAPR